MPTWVVCLGNKGKEVERGVPARRATHFPSHSVGELLDSGKQTAKVWLIGMDKTWLVPAGEISIIDIDKTGDHYEHKICNICHRLKKVEAFARNQTNLHGIVRRPSCIRCRTDIDKRPPKTKQAKDMEKQRPGKGDKFQCPICRKRSIVGVTAKVVADHNHHTGDIRDFICDSCNTGLGRFKNGENYLHNAIEYLRDRGDL